MASIEDLPEEILIKIFGYFGFFTLQKICTLVSTKWFNIIRNSHELSSEVNIDLLTLSENEIEGCLNHWPKLQRLYFKEHFAGKVSKKIPKIYYE